MYKELLCFYFIVLVSSATLFSESNAATDKLDGNFVSIFLFPLNFLNGFFYIFSVWLYMTVYHLLAVKYFISYLITLLEKKDKNWIEILFCIGFYF